MSLQHISYLDIRMLLGETFVFVRWAPARVLLHKRGCPVWTKRNANQDVVQFSHLTLLPTCCTATACCPFPRGIDKKCCRACAANWEALSFYSGCHCMSPAKCIYQVCQIWMEWCVICCLTSKGESLSCLCHVWFDIAISYAHRSSMFQHFLSYSADSKCSSSLQAELG